jgi:hypothetical protein
MINESNLINFETPVLKLSGSYWAEHYTLELWWDGIDILQEAAISTKTPAPEALLHFIWYNELKYF